MPKLNELFSVEKPSTSSSVSTSESETLSNEIITDDTENQMAETISEICDASESMAIDEVYVEEQLSETQFHFSNGVGLRNVQDDLQTLQRYWARLGEYEYEMN